jgi:hypothetical protein
MSNHDENLPCAVLEFQTFLVNAPAAGKAAQEKPRKSFDSGSVSSMLAAVNGHSDIRLLLGYALLLLRRAAVGF